MSDAVLRYFACGIHLILNPMGQMFDSFSPMEEELELHRGYLLKVLQVMNCGGWIWILVGSAQALLSTTTFTGLQIKWGVCIPKSFLKTLISPTLNTAWKNPADNKDQLLSPRWIQEYLAVILVKLKWMETISHACTLILAPIDSSFSFHPKRIIIISCSLTSTKAKVSLYTNIHLARGFHF